MQHLTFVVMVLLTEDFKACILYIENSKLESSDETIVFGASLGAAIACGAGSLDYVIGGVAASAPAKLADLLLQGKTPRGIFYLAGELDVTSNYDFGLDALSLFEITEAPKQVEVVSKSSDHGTSLLDTYPQLNARALLWARSL